jgi:hypothetical protein
MENGRMRLWAAILYSRASILAQKWPEFCSFAEVDRLLKSRGRKIYERNRS